jgi:steroid Delta-isomerase
MNVVDQSRIDALLHFYETLTPDRLRDFSFYYAQDAYFKDPFNEVNRLEAIQEIFARMFLRVTDPRFVISERVGDAGRLFLVWEMRFRMKSWKPQQLQMIRGVSHLRLGDDGKVSYHRDYWDTGEELYAKLPLIGGAVRFLRHAIG